MKIQFKEELLINYIINLKKFNFNIRLFFEFTMHLRANFTKILLERNTRVSMGITKIQLIEAGITVIIYFALNFLISRNIDRIVEKTVAGKARGKIVKKAVNLTTLTVFIIILFSIFGVDQSELAVFIGSVLTVAGIALFAQWSIISNITSGIIIFFNHPVKLNDTLTIIDKDYETKGRISDIGLFFVTLKTIEGEVITIPNNVFIQKMIKKIPNE